MQLRHHPLMSCLGHRAWPPTRWRSAGSEMNVFVTGEIGILKEVRMTTAPHMTKLFLLIEHDKRLYMGVTIVEDAAFGRQVHDLLQHHLDEPISAIGSLDVSHLL
jgi:hypothetical protein